MMKELVGLCDAVSMICRIGCKLEPYIFADLQTLRIKCAFFAPKSDLWKQFGGTTRETLLLTPHEKRKYASGRSYGATLYEVQRRFVDAQEKAYLAGELCYCLLVEELQNKYKDRDQAEQQLAEMKKKLSQCQEEIQKLEIMVA